MFVDEDDADMNINSGGNDVQSQVIGSTGVLSGPTTPVDVTVDSQDNTFLVYDVSGVVSRVPGENMPTTVTVTLLRPTSQGGNFPVVRNNYSHTFLPSYVFSLFSIRTTQAKSIVSESKPFRYDVGDTIKSSGFSSC